MVRPLVGSLKVASTVRQGASIIHRSLQWKPKSTFGPWASAPSMLCIASVYPVQSSTNYTTTSVSYLPSKHTVEETPDWLDQELRNPGLASVIQQGAKSLESTATDVQSKTRQQGLSAPTKSQKRWTQTPRQLAEAQRILDVATECLETLCYDDDGPTEPAAAFLTIGGEPIVLLEVKVNSDAKQAKVFWTLPYGILTDDRLTPTSYQRLVRQMEIYLRDRGAGKLLARHVHTRLRSYYPPRLKFQAATPDMVARAMEELLE